MAKKIIVVDDSRVLRLQVRNVLAGAGYEVIEAADGREGLDRIAAHPDAACVVCDINMPVMNGLELLKSAKEAASSPPFVMLTTEGQPEVAHEARRYGAIGCLIKPLKPNLLLAAIGRVVAG